MNSRDIFQHMLKLSTQELSQEEFSDLHEILKVTCLAYSRQMKIHGDLWNFQNVFKKM